MAAERRTRLFFPQLFDRKEVDILKKAVPEVLSRQGPEVVREKGDPTAARLAFGVHRYSEPYRRLTLLPSLVNPVRQLLQDEIYLHQAIGEVAAYLLDFLAGLHYQPSALSPLLLHHLKNS